MNLGPTELIIILAIVLLLFGSRKLPDLARSLGKSSREFKKGLQEQDEQEDEARKDAPVVKNTEDRPEPAVKKPEDRAEP